MKEKMEKEGLERKKLNSMYKRNGPLVLGFSYTEHGFLSNALANGI